MSRQDAILLLGPTGSGKTPLGEILAERGFRGRACGHFDFGANLRRIAAEGDPTGRLVAEDVAVVREALATGRLLEDHEFPLARKILESAIEQGGGDESLLVLNGLPRHVGQARDLAPTVVVSTVIALACSPETVRQRIRANPGGDRTGRVDDDAEAVARKLEIHRARTTPLIEHYRAAGAEILRIQVTPAMTPHEAWQAIQPAGR